jgi:hypothetical protein
LTDSSTDTAPAPTTEPAQVSDVAPATSSPAESTTGVETTLLDAVSAALKQGPEVTPASAVGSEKPSEPTTTKPAEAAPVEPEQGLTDEDRKLPARTQTRIQQLLNDRREATGKAQAIEKEIEGLRPKVQVYDRLMDVMQTNGISGQELDNTIEITRLIKTENYDSALKALEPIYQELKRRSGEVLPDALKERVRLGYLTEADAKAMHKAQTKVATTEAQAKQQTERTQQQERQKAFDANVQQGISAVEAWAAAKGTTDPDWKSKEQDVADEFERLTLKLTRSGKFPTPAQAIQLSEEALKTVNARVKRYAPPPTARRTPTGQFASPHSAVAAPATVQDAVKQALGMGR